MRLIRGQSLPLSRRKVPLLTLLLAIPILLTYQLLYRYDTRPGSSRSRDIYPVYHPHLDIDSLSDGGPSSSRNLTAHLVIASLRADDISWTTRLYSSIPNLHIIRYVSDFDPGESLRPEFRPPIPRKGREATIYHTYLHDFYDELPDVSIFLHAHEQPWHMDGVLQQSMSFALSHLDLAHVAARGGYANLRVSWKDACPAWIDTTIPAEKSVKQEEPFMRAAFTANFGDQVEVPTILAGPCCSQFAVTREAVHRNPRSQYAQSRDWLVTNDWSDYIAGRTWEHMWPWLFLRNAAELEGDRAARDCPAEWSAYCAMYGVCFKSDDGEVADRARSYNARWTEKEELRRDHIEEWWNRLLHPLRAADAQRRIVELEKQLDTELLEALERGRDSRIRADAMAHLFDP